MLRGTRRALFPLTGYTNTMHRMHPSTRLVNILVFTVIFGCSRHDLPGPKATRDQNPVVPAPSKTLDDFLKNRGYNEVPLTRTNGNQLDAGVTVNGTPLFFLVDTGAGNCVIDKPVADRLKLSYKRTDDILAGPTAAEPLFRSDDVRLEVGSNHSQESLLIGDLTAVNAVRTQQGLRPWDGILGNNVLLFHGAVLDQSLPKLYLLSQTVVAFDSKQRLNLKANLNTTVQLGQGVRRLLVIEFVVKEPVFVTKKAFESLSPGMTFTQVREVLGGDLTAARFTQNYSGTLAIVQGPSRIELAFYDGKVTAKAAHGIEGVAAAKLDDRAAHRPAQAPSDLDELLKANGYSQVPLQLTKDGMFDITAKVNGHSLLFVLDTGAVNTLIDEAVAERLKLPIHKSAGTFAAITGTQPLRTTVFETFSVGNLSSQEQPWVFSFSSINAERKKRDQPPLDGVLGNNFLQAHGAVIDEESALLFLLKPPLKLK